MQESVSVSKLGTVDVERMNNSVFKAQLPLHFATARPADYVLLHGIMPESGLVHESSHGSRVDEEHTYHEDTSERFRRRPTERAINFHDN